MICNAVQKLIDYAVKNELITSDDIYVVRNQLTDWEKNLSKCSDEAIDADVFNRDDEGKMVFLRFAGSI